MINFNPIIMKQRILYQRQNALHHIYIRLVGLFVLICISVANNPVVAQSLDSLHVLWIGTSIPAQCTYPKNACKSHGMHVLNRSIGSSFLSIRPFTEEIHEYTGYSLSMTIAEKEELYRPWVNDSLIDEMLLDSWKYCSYENLIFSYLDSVDIIIIDHGFNDTESTLHKEYMRGKDSVDWNSEDRSTFIGAFNYLYKQIKKVKPSVTITIGGYFQNNCSVMPRGLYVSEVSSWIAEHYDLPLIDVWNYTEIPDGFMPNSADYLSKLNETYGTNYEAAWTDSLGNISYYQKFCPDGVHPWSDPTGQSDHILDSIFSEILPSCLSPYVSTPRLMFNEVMTNNIESILYNHRYPDSWFELYNSTGATINLQNWRVGAKNDYESAYPFIHIKEVPSNGHALICCDGRDDHWEHTDFTLDPTKSGTLYLWDNDGFLVDSIHYPATLGADISYGRIMDGSAHWEFKLYATPAETNISGGSDFVLPTPILSSSKGIVEISANTFDAPKDTYIYYTLDGSSPSIHSARIQVDSILALSTDSSVVIKACLMSTNAHPSQVITRSIIKHPRNTSLPIVSLSTDNYNLYSEDNGILLGNDWNGNCFKHWERPVYLEYFETADSDEPLISQLVQADTHGLGELLYSQKSLEINAISRFGRKHFDTSSFWLSKPQVKQSSSFLLRNGGNRAIDTRFEDAFAQELFGQHLDTLEYQAYRPVIVYINGKYKGVYELRESDNEAWIESNLNILQEDVNLIESLTEDNESYRPVLELLANDSATLEDFAKYIDIPLFLNYLCVETFATNDDFPHNNVTLWCNSKDYESRFHALLRNLDYLSTTSNQTNWLNYLTCYGDDAASVRNKDAHQLFIRLLNLPEFRNAFIDRMMVYLGDFGKPSVTIPMINRMRDEIADEIGPTFATMDEQLDYERDFVGNIENRLIPYCQVRPLLLCGNMNSTFRLGGVYLMTVQGADSINGIRLTEGDFDGCCFYSRPVSLSTDSLHGWNLTVMRIDSTLEHYNFATPHLKFLPSDFGSDIDSIGLSIQTLTEMAGSHILFNEIMQSNIDCVIADNEFPDSWLELYNPTNRSISLEGYRLSERNLYNEAYVFHSSNPTELIIDSKGYKLIYCDNDSTRGALYTPFRIYSGKGSLYLWDDNGNLIDTLFYQKMPAPNVAFGRLSENSTDWEYKSEPSPSKANIYTGKSSLAPDPIFNYDSQILTGPLNVEISLPQELSETNSAQIYYTTNGDEPSQFSPSAKKVNLKIDKSTVVRAKILGKGLIPTRSVTRSYLGLPRDNDFAILSIVTDSTWLYNDSLGILSGDADDPGANYMQEWRRPINIEWLQNDNININQLGETSVGGATSRSFAQKSLKVYAHKRFGQKRFMGQLWEDKPNVIETKSFMLRNGGSRCRGSRINDAFGQRLFGRHIENLDWQSYEPVVVFVNGEYNGHYELRERTNEDFVESNYGYAEEEIYRSNNIYYGEGNYSDMMRAFWAASTNYDSLSNYVDMEELINYLCVESFTGNNDWPRNNCTSWRPIKQYGKWRWIVKDLDQFRFYPDSCNFLNYLFVEGPEGEDLKANGFDNGHHMFLKLNRLPEFRESFINHLSVYLGDFLRPSYADSILVDMRVEMQPELLYTFRLMDPTDAIFNWAKNELTLLEEYVLRRQEHLYKDITSHYNLGELIPMTIDAYDRISHNVSTLNTVPIVTTQYDGFWYEELPFTLEAPSWSYGWTMTLTFKDKAIQTEELLARPTIDLRDYPELRGISFKLRVLDEAALEEIHIDKPEDNAKPMYYDLFGRKSKTAQGIQIEIMTDGKARKIFK